MASEIQNTSEMPQALIVLGMHRSGTSALAGLIHQSGVAMGSSLMPGCVGVNDKGFWEHKEIVAIHEQLLKEMGYNWDDPRVLPDQWWETERNQSYIEKICRVLDLEFGSESLWALKDPRICRLLPLWRQVFSRLGVKPLFLHIVRNPLEVAASLKHRDRLPRPRALLLWFQHNLEAIQNSAGYPRQFITFPQLLDDGEAWMLNIFQKWELSIVTQDHAEISVETPLLTKSLRHHHASSSDLEADQDVPRLVKDLYQVLLKAAHEERDPSSEKMQRITKQYQEAVELLSSWTGLSGHFQRLLEKQNSLLEKRNARIAELVPALEDAQRFVRQRERDIEKRDSKIAELDPALKDAQNYVRQRERDIQRLNMKLDMLGKDIKGL